MLPLSFLKCFIYGIPAYWACTHANTLLEKIEIKMLLAFVIETGKIHEIGFWPLELRSARLQVQF